MKDYIVVGDYLPGNWSTLPSRHPDRWFGPEAELEGLTVRLFAHYSEFFMILYHTWDQKKSPHGPPTAKKHPYGFVSSVSGKSECSVGLALISWKLD